MASPQQYRPEPIVHEVPEERHSMDSNRAAGSADLNARILWSPARYVADVHGEGALEEAARRAGLTPSDFDGSSRWISLEAFESFLEAVWRLAGSDAEFAKAAVHRFKDSYGTVRFVLWAGTPRLVYDQCVKTYSLISKVDDLATVDLGPTHWHLRVTSKRPLSRLNCLLRQAQSSHLPTLWGLPPAQVREEACIAHGDATCELKYSWYDVKRWYTIASFGALGAGIGGVIGAVPAGWWTSVVLGAFGALIGYVVEVRRTDRTNSATRQSLMDALRRVAEEEAEARREIWALHQRQKDWSRALEESAADRSNAIRDIVERVERLQQERESTLRGFSHDLRNPLTVIECASDYFRGRHKVASDTGAAVDPETPSVLDDIDQSIVRMRRMLAELMQVATSQETIMRLVPKTLEVPDLVERMRRRLRALVHGRDIRIAVTQSAKAPPVLEVDPLLFDRVVDNLFSNAAKYTERGSILVEVDGDPKYAILRVIDTGRGIATEDVERVFRPGGSDPTRRASDSYGVGLSVVVQLLGQIGGKLDVTTALGKGTAFEVRFPTHLPATSNPPAPDATEKKARTLFSRVVRVRDRTA